MRTLSFLVLVALSAGVAHAQTGYTAPPGYLTKAGDFYARHYGFYFTEGARAQHCDPSMKGRARVLGGVAWRPMSEKQIPYASFNGTGRKFKTWTMRMGHSNCSKMTRVFSTNVLGGESKLTTVYSGSMTLPTLTSGTPKTWGSAGIVAKFSKLFVYDGKNDLLQDYLTGSGTLSNGSTIPLSNYYVDGANGVASGWSLLNLNGALGLAGNEYVPRAPRTGKRCHDSSLVNSAADAYCYAGMTIYGDTYRVTSYRCKYAPFVNTYFTAPSRPVIAAVTLAPLRTGIDVKARCNKLYVDMKVALVISTKTASPGTGFAQHLTGSTRAPTLKYINALVGLSLVAQGAWADSSKGQLGLTIATRVTLPKKGQALGVPPETVVYRYRVRGVYRPSATDASYGVGPLTHRVFQKIDRYQ